MLDSLCSPDRIYILGLYLVTSGMLFGCAAAGTDDESPVPVAEMPARQEPMQEGSEDGMDQKQHDRRIDYVELAVTDLDVAEAFYGGVFGWSFESWGPEYKSFDDGRLAGGFRLEEQVSRGGPLVIIYGVDLEAVEAAVLEHGGEIAVPIFSFPGGRRFHFLDPFGNELAVWSDPEGAEATREPE